MSHGIEYNGHMIEPTTRPNSASEWTLEVRITPPGRDPDVRRCRAPNTYPSEDVALANCLEFGRQIVDGKIKPRETRTN